MTKGQGSVGGKNLVMDKCLLLTLCLGLYKCLVASCMYVFHTVKCHMGNHNADKSATQSHGNVGNFTVPESAQPEHE